MIPYVDLVGQHAPLKQEILAAVARVLDHGQFILGEEVAEFEAAFARLCGVRYAVGVASGTDALILALRALGIGPGDQIVTPPNSFVATTSAIRLVGADPVFVDVGDDYNLDPARIEAAVTSRTRAILLVHLTGRACDMDAIGAIAARRGLFVVEDCAQAVLAEYRGRRVGSFGAIGCFSLHPLKTLSACGDAGVLTTHDPALDAKLRVLRNIGLKTREDCLAWSHNARLDTLQAAIVLTKLHHLEAWTEARCKNARRYRELLVDVPQLRLPADDGNDRRSVYHTFIVRAQRRDELKRALEAAGIGSAIHYPTPIHLTAVGRELGFSEHSFPNAERQAQEILSLPIHHLLSDQDLKQVAAATVAFYTQRR